MAGLAIFIAGSLMASLRRLHLAACRPHAAGSAPRRRVSSPSPSCAIAMRARDGARDVVRHGHLHHHPGAGAGDGPGPAVTSAPGGSMFDLLLVAGIIVALWAGLRLPETKRQHAGEPLSLGASLGCALETPQTIGYAVSGGLIFGCVLGYVSSAQQVFVDMFSLGFGFPLAFGGNGADDRARLADQRHAGRAARHAPAVARGARRVHRAVGACSSLAALLGSGFWLFIGSDGAALLPVRAHRSRISMPWPWSRRATMPAWRRRSSASCRPGIGALAAGFVGHMSTARAAAGAGLPRPQRSGRSRSSCGWRARAASSVRAAKHCGV